MSDLIARLRERAEFEDKRVLDEATALGFVPEVYSGSQTGALLHESAAALEAAREDAELSRAIERAAKDLAPGWEIVIGVEKDAAWIEVFDWDGDQHEFSPDYTFAETIDAAIDKARGIVPEAGQGLGK